MKSVKIKLTFEWDISEKEYKENKDFYGERTFSWKSDPVSLFHFLNNVRWPELTRKSVDRVS
jgi:hypothetical protein